MNDTLWPKLIRFSQKLTQHLAPFYGDDLRVQPEDVRDNATELAEIEAAKAFLSVNEVRARYFKLPPVTWGERPAGTATPTDNPV